MAKLDSNNDISPGNETTQSTGPNIVSLGLGPDIAAIGDVPPELAEMSQKIKASITPGSTGYLEYSSDTPSSPAPDLSINYYSNSDNTAAAADSSQFPVPFNEYGINPTQVQIYGYVNLKKDDLPGMIESVDTHRFERTIKNNIISKVYADISAGDNPNELNRLIELFDTQLEEATVNFNSVLSFAAAVRLSAPLGQRTPLSIFADPKLWDSHDGNPLFTSKYVDNLVWLEGPANAGARLNFNANFGSYPIGSATGRFATFLAFETGLLPTWFRPNPILGDGGPYMSNTNSWSVSRNYLQLLLDLQLCLSTGITTRYLFENATAACPTRPNSLKYVVAGDKKRYPIQSRISQLSPMSLCQIGNSAFGNSLPRLGEAQTTLITDSNYWGKMISEGSLNGKVKNTMDSIENLTPLGQIGYLMAIMCREMSMSSGLGISLGKDPDVASPLIQQRSVGQANDSSVLPGAHNTLRTMFGMSGFTDIYDSFDMIEKMKSCPDESLANLTVARTNGAPFTDSSTPSTDFIVTLDTNVASFNSQAILTPTYMIDTLATDPKNGSFDIYSKDIVGGAISRFELYGLIFKRMTGSHQAWSEMLRRNVSDWMPANYVREIFNHLGCWSHNLDILFKEATSTAQLSDTPLFSGQNQFLSQLYWLTRYARSTNGDFKRQFLINLVTKIALWAPGNGAWTESVQSSGVNISPGSAGSAAMSGNCGWPRFQNHNSVTGIAATTGVNLSLQSRLMSRGISPAMERYTSFPGRPDMLGLPGSPNEYLSHLQYGLPLLAELVKNYNQCEPTPLPGHGTQDPNSSGCDAGLLAGGIATMNYSTLMSEACLSGAPGTMGDNMGGTTNLGYLLPHREQMWTTSRRSPFSLIAFLAQSLINSCIPNQLSDLPEGVDPTSYLVPAINGEGFVTRFSEMDGPTIIGHIIQAVAIAVDHFCPVECQMRPAGGPEPPVTFTEGGQIDPGNSAGKLYSEADFFIDWGNTATTIESQAVIYVANTDHFDNISVVTSGGANQGEGSIQTSAPTSLLWRAIADLADPGTQYQVKNDIKRGKDIALRMWFNDGNFNPPSGLLSLNVDKHPRLLEGMNDDSANYAQHVAFPTLSAMQTLSAKGSITGGDIKNLMTSLIRDWESPVCLYSAAKVHFDMIDFALGPAQEISDAFQGETHVLSPWLNIVQNRQFLASVTHRQMVLASHRLAELAPIPDALPWKLKSTVNSSMYTAQKFLFEWLNEPTIDIFNEGVVYGSSSGDYISSAVMFLGVPSIRSPYATSWDDDYLSTVFSKVSITRDAQLRTTLTPHFSSRDLFFFTTVEVDAEGIAAAWDIDDTTTAPSNFINLIEKVTYRYTFYDFQTYSFTTEHHTGLELITLFDISEGAFEFTTRYEPNNSYKPTPSIWSQLDTWTSDTRVRARLANTLTDFLLKQYYDEHLSFVLHEEQIQLNPEEQKRYAAQALPLLIQVGKQLGIDASAVTNLFPESGLTNDRGISIPQKGSAVYQKAVEFQSTFVYTDSGDSVQAWKKPAMTEADIQILTTFLKTKPFLACKLGSRFTPDTGIVAAARQGVSEYIFTPSLFSKIYAVWCPLDNFPINVETAVDQGVIGEITDNPEIPGTDIENNLLSKYSWNKEGYTSPLTMDQYRVQITKGPTPSWPPIFEL
jgi:hypothetical protein